MRAPGKAINRALGEAVVCYILSLIPARVTQGEAEKYLKSEVLTRGIMALHISPHYVSEPG